MDFSEAMLSNTKSAVYEFDDFRIDAGRRLLWNRDEPLMLTPKVFDTLLYLVQNPGKTISKDELIAAIWPDTIVEENNLNKNISALRQLLGEKPGEHRFIATVPGKGYKFVASVVESPVKGTQHADIVESSVTETAVPTPTPRPVWRQYVRIGVPALLLVTLSVVLAGFHYLRPRPALTDKDVIVLADFDNHTGEPVFDNTLKEALAIGLEQSPFLNVLPDLRVEQVLKQMELSPGNRITPEVGREICLRTASKALLTGSIASLGSHYALQFKVTNCQTGDVLGAEQEEAESRENVLQALGHAATTLRSKLGESLASVQKYDKPLEEATTSSLEALQEFSEGVRTFQEKGSFDAIPFFKRAVQLDPNFALAYHYLGALHGNLGERTLQIENLRRGYALLGRASAREQYTDSGLFYQVVTGELQKASEQYQLVTQAYPRDFYGHNNLGIVYSLLGQQEKALKEQHEALRVQADSFVGYSTVSFAYLTLDRVDDARAVVNEALSRKIDAPPLHSLLYILAFLKNDAGAMQQELGWAVGKPVDESWALLRESNTQAYYGRLKKAREVSRAAEAAARRDGAKEPAAFIEALAALREADFGNSAQAQQGIRTALTLAVNRDMREVAAATLAGARSSNGPQRQLDGLNEEYPLDTLVQNYWLPTIHAQIELEAGRAAHALALLESARPYEFTSVYNLASCYVPMHAVYVRGQAYLAAGNGAAASTEFQKILDHRGLVQNNVIGALAHLYLGRARALEAQSLHNVAADKARAQARTAYQDFLTLWKDADPDIPILKQARAEYAKLQ